jgi:hypothetical protein
MAGAWLDYVLRRGWPLLAPAVTGESAIVSAEESPFRGLSVPEANALEQSSSLDRA